MEGDTMTEKESYELTASNNKRYIAGICKKNIRNEMYEIMFLLKIQVRLYWSMIKEICIHLKIIVWKKQRLYP